MNFEKKLKGRGTGKEPKTVHSCRFHCIMTTLGKLLKNEFERGELEKSRLYKNIRVHHPLGRQGVEYMRGRRRSPSTPKSAPVKHQTLLPPPRVSFCWVSCLSQFLPRVLLHGLSKTYSSSLNSTLLVPIFFYQSDSKTSHIDPKNVLPSSLSVLRRSCVCWFGFIFYLGFCSRFSDQGLSDFQINTINLSASVRARLRFSPLANHLLP